MIVSICTTDHQPLDSHKEHTPGCPPCSVHSRVQAPVRIYSCCCSYTRWSSGGAVSDGSGCKSDDALLTPAVWPGSWQGLGTPVSHHPYLVLNRFIKQWDISLICWEAWDMTQRLSISPGQTQCHCHGPSSQSPSADVPCSPTCSGFIFSAFDFKYHHDWEISSNIKGRALEKNVT